MNASIAIQVLPTVDSKDELIRIVDEVIAYIKSFGLHTEVGPFETTVEGDYDALMEIKNKYGDIPIYITENGHLYIASADIN